MLRFRVLGALFSSFGCFVLRSSFSRASFSKLPFLCEKVRVCFLNLTCSPKSSFSGQWVGNCLKRSCPGGVGWGKSKITFL